MSDVTHHNYCIHISQVSAANDQSYEQFITYLINVTVCVCVCTCVIIQLSDVSPMTQVSPCYHVQSFFLCGIPL